MAKKALHASWLSYPHVCLDIIKNINIFLKAKGAGDEPSHDTPEKTSDCWMREQWHGWSDRYPWLYLKVSKLGEREMQRLCYCLSEDLEYTFLMNGSME